VPTFDKVIRGGTVIDGRNLPRCRADVGIRDGRVAEIGRISPTDGAEVIDAGGLIVAPGFVDLHTHYDAQLFWDPYCSLSGWHGVTSVVIGNCGFGFAPARPGDREYLMRSLNRVEAIPYECIEPTLAWDWETFPQWMDAVDRAPKGVNMLAYVPVNPLLVYVMGYEAAKSRDATDGERAEMARILGEAMAAGACGWSAQRSAPGSGVDLQRDYDGSPFATDLMSNETALALGRVLADFDAGFIQTLLFTGDREGDWRHLEELAEVSDSAVLVNTITTDERMPDFHRADLAWIRRSQERGLKIYAQCLTSAAGFTFTFEDWNLFDDSEAWREVTLGTPAERLAKFADPARRAALKADPPIVFDLNRLVILRTTAERFLPAKGTLLPDAARILGYDEMIDLLVDMVVADDLKTLFQADNFNSGMDLQNELVVAPYSLWGVSDGGAHTKFLTSGAYPTESIIDFVRERELVTLEEAHWRLSALPAHCAGFQRRGQLIEGAPADIVVYDYDRLTLLDEEVAHDFPGGEWRRIRRGDGYHYTLVNGEITFVDGKDTGAVPGRLLRHGEG